MVVDVGMVNIYVIVILINIVVYMLLIVFLYFGFICLIILKEFEEVVRIDGVGMLKIFFMIVFFLLKLIIVIICIIFCVFIWNDY